MKTMLCVLVLAAVALSTSAAAFDDPPKDAACVQDCIRQYSGEWRQCGEVKQCKEYVVLRTQICVHHCPNAK